MTEKDKEILIRVIRRCERVKQDFEIHGNTFEDFNNNPTFKDSVSHNIEQIGELVNGLSEEFKESTSNQMRWELMYGIRNRIVHSYDDVRFDVVWESAVYDVPKLLEFCEKTIHFDE